MSEKENIQKTDFLSNLRSQKPNTTTKTQDEEEDYDIWNEASDEDEEQQVTKISNKMASNLLAKEDNTKKKYTSLKDVVSDKKNTNNANYRKNPNNQYQNKKPAANKQDLGFNKPVFVNSNKFYNKNDNFAKTEGNNDFGFNSNNNFDHKYNNKYDYKSRQNYNYNTSNNSLNERPKFFSNKPADDNKQQSFNQANIVDKYNMSTNNVYSNPDRNKVNEKEDTLKKIGTFNSLVKDLQEENSKIKAPKRDYTEIDLTKNKYVSERNKEKESNYLQKPQFVSSHTNEEPRFVELEKDKDLFLKHVQKVENANDNQGFSAVNSKKEKFHNKNREKDPNLGLDEPRRFINSKKIANENQNLEESKAEEESHREGGESFHYEHHNYGTEYRKFKKPYDDFMNYDSLINREAHNQEGKHDNEKLAHDYKDSYKSHYVNNKQQKNVAARVSDGKDNKSRKNSALPEPIILKKTDKTLKELLDGK